MYPDNDTVKQVIKTFHHVERTFSENPTSKNALPEECKVINSDLESISLWMRKWTFDTTRQ